MRQAGKIFQQIIPCTEFLLAGGTLRDLQRAKWCLHAQMRDRERMREYNRGYMRRWRALQGEAWKARHAADMRRWREERRKTNA